MYMYLHNLLFLPSVKIQDKSSQSPAPQPFSPHRITPANLPLLGPEGQLAIFRPLWASKLSEEEKGEVAGEGEGEGEGEGGEKRVGGQD